VKKTTEIRNITINNHKLHLVDNLEIFWYTLSAISIRQRKPKMESQKWYTKIEKKNVSKEYKKPFVSVIKGTNQKKGKK